MSVVSTRTSVLSILKIKRDVKSSVPHKVRFQLPSNVRQIFLDKKNKVSSKEYENLVCTIRDSEISDADLKKLLEEAKNCVALLDYELRLFVQALVILGWTHRSPATVQAYSDFITTVVSVHQQHAKDVIDQLVKLFPNCDASEWKDGVPGPVDETNFINIHKILKTIIRNIPLTSNMLLASLKKNFPFYTISPDRQQSYMYNTLKVLEYMPQHRRTILMLYVDRLLNLDVQVPAEDIEMEEQFAMEDVPQNPVAEALDLGMCLMFRYIDNTTKSSSGELRWNETKTLFLDLLEVLDKCLLSTYGSCHVQYLLFYYVSLKSSLAQSLLNSLWQKVLGPSAPVVVRKMCVYYMASFLARANFIPTGFLKTYLSEMSTWIHRYISTQDSISKPNREIRAHPVFYAVCQALFYVIAFRHRDLVDSKIKLAFLQSLNLSKIVTSSLNPLRVCLPQVVNQFAFVAREYQLAYCYTIMDNNRRCYLEQPVPEAFFPFDPYALKKSRSYITPLYLGFAQASTEEEAAVEEEERAGQTKEEEDMEDEDEFLQQHVAPDKPLHDFSYSTSPGFKPMSV